MSKVNFIETTCTTGANFLKKHHPYNWDLNAYRGCQHNCQYCYAMYSHKYLEKTADDFSTDIFIKTNIAEELEKQLASPKWKRQIVNLGGVTDTYQPAEKKYKLMPDILKLLIKYKTPAIISTKSDLVLRDFDLIDQLSRITYVNVAASVISTDDDLLKKLEPGAISFKSRFSMVKEFSKTNASTGIHVMPIIPYLTDSKENIESLCENAAESKAQYFLPGTLYLRGATKPHFFAFIEQNYPHLSEKLKVMFSNRQLKLDYKQAFYKMLNFYRDKYGLTGNYSRLMKEKMHKEETMEQLTLF